MIDLQSHLNALTVELGKPEKRPGLPKRFADKARNPEVFEAARKAMRKAGAEELAALRELVHGDAGQSRISEVANVIAVDLSNYHTKIAALILIAWMGRDKRHDLMDAIADAALPMMPASVMTRELLALELDWMFDVFYLIAISEQDTETAGTIRLKLGESPELSPRVAAILNERWRGADTTEEYEAVLDILGKMRVKACIPLIAGGLRNPALSAKAAKALQNYRFSMTEKQYQQYLNLAK